VPPTLKVAVLGGGVGGLTAAHELAERGFAVTIYERRAWGGKARSTEVPNSATGGRKPLPGEHGWRIFFGFYQNLPDTLARIPYGSSSRVFDNLVAGPQERLARVGRGDMTVPLGAPDLRPTTPEQVVDTVAGALATRFEPEAVVQFVNRLVVFLSSCDARRAGQWEDVRWADFIGANRYGEDYRKTLVVPFSQMLQASKPEDTAASFPAHIFELLVYTELGRGANGPLDRVFDLPTNEAFIGPWLAHLRALGVRLRNAHELTGFVMQGGRVTGARVRTSRGTSVITADWFVSALPVERARTMWNERVLAADPSLARMDALATDWMNGLQFYLRENRPLAKGHVLYLDSPWLVTSVNQAQFWRRDFARAYGDGRARDCLSAIVSDWNTPGVIYGKPARECSPDEVAREVWEQMKRHVADRDSAGLTDDLLLGYQIDPGMLVRDGRLLSEDPLVLPTVGSRRNRPLPATAVPNLMLTGDYLEGDWEVANMESANYNSRRMVNASLERAGSSMPACKVTASYRPPEWEPFKRIDEQRYRSGQPNLFYADVPGGLDGIRASLRDAGRGIA